MHRGTIMRFALRGQIKHEHLSVLWNISVNRITRSLPRHFSVFTFEMVCYFCLYLCFLGLLMSTIKKQEIELTQKFESILCQAKRLWIYPWFWKKPVQYQCYKNLYRWLSTLSFIFVYFFTYLGKIQHRIILLLTHI